MQFKQPLQRSGASTLHPPVPKSPAGCRPYTAPAGASPRAMIIASDWQHKRRHMNLPDLDFEQVRSDLFYSLRLEHLQDDLNRHLLPLLPKGTPGFGTLPRENTKPGRANMNQPGFSTGDLRRIAAVNPRWNHWQQQVYGQAIAT